MPECLPTSNCSDELRHIVLQAFVHAPMLRDFFLNNGHLQTACKHRLTGPCMSCEMVRVVSYKLQCHELNTALPF